MEAMESHINPVELFVKFKKLHPYNREAYVPSEQNIARWKYHIAQYEKHELPLKEYLHSPKQWAIELADSRRVRSFDDFDPDTQRRYLHLSGRFPGIQLYACGSRVKGDWIDDETDSRIVEMRRELGKANKRSDFDFTIPSMTADEKYKAMRLLPAGYDLLIFGVPEDEMIPIPMWDFSKLPKDQHKTAIEHFKAQRWSKLMQIYNTYQLSPAQFCCDEKPVIRWFQWAIENEIIRADE